MAMMLVRFQSEQGAGIGLVDGERVVDLRPRYASIAQVLTDWDAAIAWAAGAPAVLPLSAVQLGKPLDPDSRVFCVALNYHAHALESGGERAPAAPVIFPKPITAMIGPGEPIQTPAHTGYLDYEAELGVVIGRRGRDIPVADALSYVGGYTCFNDISARDQQSAQLGSSQIIDWFSAKMFDRATPIGPGIVPASAVGDPQALRVRLYLNGERLQDGPTALMVHSVAALVAFVSSRTELLPGDVIATGTPAGVGKARGIRLKPGDEVSVEIAGVGRLTNTVA